MSKFVYLFTAEDQEGQTIVFQARGAFSAKTGDLILYNGDLFKIRKTNYCSAESDDYAMISDISTIRNAEVIYTPFWEDKENIIDEPS